LNETICGPCGDDKLLAATADGLADATIWLG
jgi:hypothetical protein